MSSAPSLALTGDQLYELIKQYEEAMPTPAPYVTINVGTFDFRARTWTGLTSQVVTDPEPLEHEPSSTDQQNAAFARPVRRRRTLRYTPGRTIYSSPGR